MKANGLRNSCLSNFDLRIVFFMLVAILPFVLTAVVAVYAC
jgi:hypothetical protein